MGIRDIGDFPYAEWEKKLPGYCFVRRDAEILKLCEGKTVLHLGAADSPMHIDKAMKNELLHQKLSKSAKKLIGIDVDEDAIACLKEKFNITDIYTKQEIDNNKTLSACKYDVVLCADIIEHVLDIEDLISYCKEFMSQKTLLVVTTINALSLKAVVRAILNREALHHDHVSYFSFGSLAQLLHKKGVKVTGYGTFSYKAVNPVVGYVLDRFFSIISNVADGILVVGILDDSRK